MPYSHSIILHLAVKVKTGVAWGGPRGKYKVSGAGLALVAKYDIIHATDLWGRLFFELEIIVLIKAAG